MWHNRTLTIITHGDQMKTRFANLNPPDSNIRFFTTSHYFPVWSLQSVQSSLHPNINDVADAGTATLPVYSKDCSFRTAGLSFVVPVSVSAHYASE